MAKSKKITLADLPEAGTVYAMPLEDGRFGICRVIRKEQREIPCVVVTASDWIGNEPPQLNDPVVRKILVLNHHFFSERPEVVWVSSPPPKEFRMQGKIAVLPQDAKVPCNCLSAWDGLQIQVLAQWRWDNQREAVLAEDEKKKLIETEKTNAAAQKRAEYLSSVTFSSLLDKNLFPTWDDYPPKAAKEGCEKIVYAFIKALAEAKPPLERDFVSHQLKMCIEDLNHLDSRCENFIETVEREDLCEIFQEILNAAKCPDMMEQVEAWKDW